MSRLNQIIQSCRQRSATVPTTTAPPTEAITLPKAATSPEDASKDGGNALDQLKPKIKEVLEEIKKEEEKLCSDAHSVNPREIYHKLPVLSRVAHSLPEPIRLRLKAALCKLFPEPANKPKVTAANKPTSSNSAEDQKLCRIPFNLIPGGSGKEPEASGLVDGPVPGPAAVVPESAEAN